MILRYSVEIEGIRTFTAKRQVKSPSDGTLWADHLKERNVKFGYNKYSNFRLYTDDNELIKFIKT